MNQQAAPITVNKSTTNQTLANLRQFFYTLEMIKRLNDCFMQLCTPWWWASEGRNM